MVISIDVDKTSDNVSCKYQSQMSISTEWKVAHIITGPTTTRSRSPQISDTATFMGWKSPRRIQHKRNCVDNGSSVELTERRKYVAISASAVHRQYAHLDSWCRATDCTYPSHAASEDSKLIFHLFPKEGSQIYWCGWPGDIWNTHFSNTRKFPAYPDQGKRL